MYVYKNVWIFYVNKVIQNLFVKSFLKVASFFCMFLFDKM